MEFYEKLDFLMKITETSNSTLGKALSFDASYISRIRTGKRSPSKKNDFLESASLYFADHIKNSYQIQLLSELLHIDSEWPEDHGQQQQILYNWLADLKATDSTPVQGLLYGISKLSKTSFPVQNSCIEEVIENNENNIQFYYGNEGKRRAVILFLSELIKMDTPPALLLYSNEEFDWIYEDAVFAKKWALLLANYIKKGGKIKIIHTISRASGEMLEALKRWIPIYITGAVDPYYYPKIMDRIFRKTIFIAQGVSCITAESVGNFHSENINCFVHDKTYVECLEKEFNHFLDMCKPLMNIYGITKSECFFEDLKNFNDIQGNTITVCNTPSYYTMPQSVAKSITSRLNNNRITKRQQEGSCAFKNIIENGYNLTEVLNLPALHSIDKENFQCPVCDLYNKPGLMYTLDEFVDHLKAIVYNLKCYDNYNVYINGAIPENELVFIKEDLGVILVKSDIPTIAFSINEQRMISAFWNYMVEIIERETPKEKTIKELEKLIEKLS